MTTFAGNYGRQSKGNTISIASQIKKGQMRCSEKGWEVKCEYTDSVSASEYGTKERDGWAQLVADVTAGTIQVVVLWDASRGDRTMRSWVDFVDLCDRQRVLIHAVKRDRTYEPWKSADRKTLLNDGVEHEHYSRELAENTLRGVEDAAMAGRPHGPVAYGWRRVWNGRKYENGRAIFEWEIDDDQAAVVREIVHAVAKHTPISEIMRNLNYRNIPGPSGGPWSRTTINHVARNRRYLAIRNHKGTEYEAEWPPILTTEAERAAFAQACAVLGAPDRKRSAPGALRHLLSCLADCQVCHGVLNVQPPRDGRMARYRCLEKGHTSIPKDHLDQWVIDLAIARLSQPDARELFAPDTAAEQAARAEVARVERLIAENREAYENDVVDALAYAGKRRKLEPKLATARAKVAELAKGNVLRDLLGDDWATEVVRPRFAALPIAAQREVLRALFVSISVAPTTQRFTRHTPEETRLAAVDSRVTVVWVGEENTMESVVA